MQLDTQRLIMYPLDSISLSEVVKEYAGKNAELCLAYKEMLTGALKSKDKYEWYSPWVILLRENNQKVGYAGFRGIAVNGAVEIGYGIDEDYCGRGYATEAVDTMCRWALISDGVHAVEAEACADNMKSIKVLYKCGFAPTGKKGMEGIRFKRTII